MGGGKKKKSFERKGNFWLIFLLRRGGKRGYKRHEKRLVPDRRTLYAVTREGGDWILREGGSRIDR